MRIKRVKDINRGVGVRNTPENNGGIIVIVEIEGRFMKIPSIAVGNDSGGGGSMGRGVR